MKKRKKHADRRDEILNTMMHVLAFEGDASATMRTIADRIGISLAAVQYYFPTRKELLKHTIEKCIGSGLREMHDLEDDPDSDPRDALHKVINIHFDSSRDPLISSFFAALWALTSHDEEMLGIVNEFYESECKKYAVLIKRANPALTKRTCETRANLLMAQVEGLVLFIAPGRLNKARIRDIEKELHVLIDKAIVEACD